MSDAIAIRSKINLAAQATIRMLQDEYESLSPNIHCWDWQPGVGLYGLMRAYEAVGEPDCLAYTRYYVDRLLEQDIVSYSINGSIMFQAVLKLYQHTGDPRYEQELRYFLRWLLRSAPKCQNDCLEHTWTEVKVNLAEQVWIDTLFMAGIVLADSYRVFRRQDCKEEALLQFSMHQACLQDEQTGLYRHSYKVTTGSYMAGAFWGRGNGWMAASVADMLEAIGVNESAHSNIITSFKKQMTAVKTLQEPDGAFHTILDDKHTYVETSATAALGYAALKGVRLGILGSEFEDMGQRALRAVLNNIDSGGTVHNVSSGTSGFITYEEYNTIPVAPRLYGQALAILLMTEYLPKPLKNAPEAIEKR
jgi:unsaturated rhamnogalacturonyl hydrolase